MHRFDAWHKTRLGYLLFAIVELLITYGFASLAINDGNLWWYLVTLIFLVGTLQNLTKFVALFFKRQPPKPKVTKARKQAMHGN